MMTRRRLLAIFTMPCIIGLLMTVPVHAKRRTLVTVDGKNAVGRLFMKARSCTPTLAWVADALYDRAESLTYDVAIYVALKRPLETSVERGERIFYQEKIAAATVTVSPPLAPKGKYLWSMRARTARGYVSPWYVHDAIHTNFLETIWYRHVWLGITTPRRCE
jgi:hypothetical protein